MEQQKFDVAVIGSGIGGLGAGALLAHSGYKTLVVEGLDRLGGRMSTIEYQAFKLPTGAIAIHRGDQVDDIFKHVGVPVELLDVPPLYYRLKGKDFAMPAKGSISTMLDLVGKLDVDRTKLVTGLMRAGATEKIMGAFRKGIKEPEKEQMSFKDWLLQYTDNELAHDIFDCISCALLGCHTFEVTAAGMFAWFVKMGGARDVGVAPHGNIRNMEKLAEVVKKNGAVWTNCPATGITVSGGAAAGIIVQKDGKEVRVAAKMVISNARPERTVKLAGESNFDEGYLRLLRLRIRPHPCILTFVASDIPLWPEEGSAAILMLTGTRRIKSFVPISIIAPQLAPPGQHLMFGLGSPVSSEKRVNVEEETRQTMLDLEEQLPRFKEHGKVLMIDVRNIDHQFPDVVTRPGAGLPPETPVKNLYNVGDAILAPGLVGTTGAADSALRVVEIVKKKLK